MIDVWIKKFGLLIGPLAALAMTNPALAANCETDQRAKVEAALGRSPGELAAYLAPLMSKPRYFEAQCDQPRLDHPLYPGMPVKACTYEHLGLKGFVMLANPGADLAAKWISNACADQKDTKTCMVRLTSYAWCSNQLSFPVAGNVIEPVSAGGGKNEVGVNVAFLHGVTVQRPDWLPERTAVDIQKQKSEFETLAASAQAYKGSVSQVARPAGVRREVFVQYALGSANLQVGDLGRSCPENARRSAWLDVSRILYNRSWRTGKNPMFEAAAAALMAGENPGPVDCAG